MRFFNYRALHQQQSEIEGWAIIKTLVPQNSIFSAS